MGVTIHFEGRLGGEGELKLLLLLASEFAARHGWSIERVAGAEAVLHRVRDDSDSDYVGPVRGLVVYAHDDCDPVRLEFDRDLYIREFVKTQFAGEATHLAVVDLLRALEPCFAELRVEDEAGFWATNDIQVLRNHFRAFEEALQDELRKHPGARVKVKLADGRIVDMMT